MTKWRIKEIFHLEKFQLLFSVLSLRMVEIEDITKLIRSNQTVDQKSTDKIHRLVKNSIYEIRLVCQFYFRREVKVPKLPYF